MKNYIILIREYLLFIALLLVVFTLPFGIILNSITIIFFSACWLLEAKPNYKVQKLKEKHLIWLFASIYLVNVLSAVFLNGGQEGFFQLEKKLSLLIFPLILGTTKKKFSSRQIDIFLIFFILACFIASLICIVYAIIHYDGNQEIFYTNNLTAPVRFHYIYFALFTAFSIILVWYFLFRYELSIVRRGILGILSIYFLIFLILLSAKMVIGAFLVAIGIFFILMILEKGKFKYLFILGGLFLVFFLMLFSFEVTRERMMVVFHDNPAYNPLSLRLIHWKCSWEIATENPVYFFLGVGAGNEQEALNQCYISENYWGVQHNYNAHSQYFQFLLNSGLIGVTLFLLILIIPFVFSIKQKKYLYTAFLVLFYLGCLTESMLTVQKGIVFFALFNSFFAFIYRVKE